MSEDGSIKDPHTEWNDKVKADDPDTFAKMEKVYHQCRNSKYLGFLLLKSPQTSEIFS